MTDDLALFDPDEARRKRGQAIFSDWWRDPNRRPTLRNHRDTTILNRIDEALAGGFDDATIRAALDECWKFSSKQAWEVALNIAYRTVRQQVQPTMNATQQAIFRVRANGGLATKP